MKAILQSDAIDAIVDFVVGGSGHRWPEASEADVVVVVDSLNELEDVPDLSKLVKLPLGDHETVLTLLERNCERNPKAAQLHKEYAERGTNLNLSDGMAQDPRIGELAIDDAAASGRLEEVFREVLIRLLERCNGKLAPVDV